MIPSLMILSGSLIILALAGYWMRRAAKAERRVAELEKINERHFSTVLTLAGRLGRIINLSTPNMAHIGKVAVGIAKGLR